MIFDYNIPVLSIVLFSVAFVGLLYISFVYLHRLSIVRRRRQQCNDAVADVSEPLPKVSVVVCARNDANSLADNLPAILTQAYPGSFEVIVVNDGVPDDTDMVVTRLKADFPNLYLTFVPDSTRNISRKKLAIQLGVKAAKGDVIVVTDAFTHVPSDRWLQQMVKHFVDPAVEVVIGYNAQSLPDRHFGGRLLTAFDSAADASTWLSSAINGNAYRGCGSNIAYRRELYFRNNGFHNSFNLRYGDDDLFVNEITTPANTVVELSDSTLGTIGPETGVRERYGRDRVQHSFTGRKLPKTSRGIMALGEWCIWIVLICSILGAVFAGVGNIFGWALAAVLVLVTLVVVIVGWRKTVISLGGPKMALSIPFIAAFRPIRNILVNISSHSSKHSWYTWN